VSAPLRQARLRPSPSHAGRQWVASGHDPLGMKRSAAAAEAASNAALNASSGADVGGAAALEVSTTALEVTVLLQLPTTALPDETTLATLRHLIAQLSWSASAVPGASAARAHLEASAGQPSAGQPSAGQPSAGQLSGLAARPKARVPPTWQLLLLSARPLCSEPPELIDLLRQLPTMVHLAPARERQPSAVPAVSAVTGANGGLDESVVSGADQSVVSGAGRAAGKRAAVLLGARPMPAQDTMTPVTAPREAPPTPLSAEVRRVWDLSPDCL
jgi:hypothetical protein